MKSKIEKIVNQFKERIEKLSQTMDQPYVSGSSFNDLEIERRTYTNALNIIYGEFPELKPLE